MRHKYLSAESAFQFFTDIEDQPWPSQHFSLNAKGDIYQAGPFYIDFVRASNC